MNVADAYGSVVRIWLIDDKPGLGDDFRELLRTREGKPTYQSSCPNTPTRHQGHKKAVEAWRAEVRQRGYMLIDQVEEHSGYSDSFWSRAITQGYILPVLVRPPFGGKHRYLYRVEDVDRVLRQIREGRIKVSWKVGERLRSATLILPTSSF